MLRPPRLPSLTGRDPALMAYLCEMQAFMVQNQLVSGVGYRINKSANGTALIPDFGIGGKGQSSTNRKEQMIIMGIKADWLLCLRFDTILGTRPAAWTAADFIKVAKPYRLRFTPFDGQTVNGMSYHYAGETFLWSRRRETGPTATEIQIVVTPWYPGDIIFAEKNILGGTGVIDYTDPLNPVKVDYLDTNNAARAWAQTDDPDPIDSSL